jgi:hypothetical protein
MENQGRNEGLFRIQFFLPVKKGSTRDQHITRSIWRADTGV